MMREAVDAVREADHPGRMMRPARTRGRLAA
jgi:hypothetical protein